MSDPLYEVDMPEGEDDPNIANSHADSQKSNFACEICQPIATFSNSTNYKRHMMNKNIHPDVSDADVANRTEGVVHFQPTHKKFPCSQCPRSFFSSLGARRHERLAHEWVPVQQQCPLCSKILPNANVLQRHMRKRHVSSGSLKKESNSCEMCAKTFVTPTIKNRHVEAVHFRDKTSCPYGCETEIGSEAEWVTHLEGCESPKMSAELERICQYCPAMFRNNLLQMEHRLRVHPETTYACAICERRFTFKMLVNNHRCAD
ncbi:zinc finger protein 563-like [Folsomia candida]|nr:zinc finger protein 563-like [Folsomia candida]